MNISSTFTVPHTVMSRAVGNETVLLDLDSGTYFGLDEVGARVWDLIKEGKSFGEICGTVVSEYEVTRDLFEKDATALITELQSKKLVREA